MTFEATRSSLRRGQYGTGRLLGLTVLFCVALVALVYGHQFQFQARAYSTWFDLAGIVGMATFCFGLLRSVTRPYHGRLLVSVLTQGLCFAMVVATNLLLRHYYTDYGFMFPTVTTWAFYYPTVNYVGQRAMCVGAWGIACTLVVTASVATFEKQQQRQQLHYVRLSQFAVGILVAHLVAILLPIWSVIEG